MQLQRKLAANLLLNIEWKNNCKGLPSFFAATNFKVNYNISVKLLKMRYLLYFNISSNKTIIV